MDATSVIIKDNNGNTVKSTYVDTSEKTHYLTDSYKYYQIITDKPVIVSIYQVYIMHDIMHK